MSWINEIGTLPQKYEGASASSVPSGAADDFAKIADRARAAALSDG